MTLCGYRDQPGFHVSRGIAPRPVPDLRQVLAVFVNVDLVLDQLVSNHLLQVIAFATQTRDAIHHVLHRMEAVQIVLRRLS